MNQSCYRFAGGPAATHRRISRTLTHRASIEQVSVNVPTARCSTRSRTTHSLATFCSIAARAAFIEAVRDASRFRSSAASAATTRRIPHPRCPARHAPAQAHLRRAAGEGRRALHREGSLMDNPFPGNARLQALGPVVTKAGLEPGTARGVAFARLHAALRFPSRCPTCDLPPC